MDDRREDKPDAEPNAAARANAIRDSGEHAEPHERAQPAANDGADSHVQTAAADVEALLRRYRPAGPPASMRARILSESEPSRPAAPAATRRARIVGTPKPSQAAAQAAGHAEPSLAAEMPAARIGGAPPGFAGAPTRAAGRAWPWLAAAAALLLCALGLRVGGDGLIAQTQAQLAFGAGSAADRDRADATLATVAETLGGDDIAWRAAASLVRQEQEQQQKRRNEASGDRQDPGSDMP